MRPCLLSLLAAPAVLIAENAIEDPGCNLPPEGGPDGEMITRFRSFPGDPSLQSISKGGYCDTFVFEPNLVQSLWFGIQIPKDAKAGT
jgi:hypothetical protein